MNEYILHVRQDKVSILNVGTTLPLTQDWSVHHIKINTLMISCLLE